MAFTLGLAQTKHPEDGDVVALVDGVSQEAKRRGVDLLVFSESLMTRYELPSEEFESASQPVGGAFCQDVEAIAARYGLWMVYTCNEANPKGKPFNTAIVVDDQGKRRSVYRKLHLFESSAIKESSRMSAGDEMPAVVKTPFCNLGVAICYDLRFPEVARAMALKGANLIVYPSAWVQGHEKVNEWQTLLGARAIENGCFVAGVSRCDRGYIGHSCAVSPRGVRIGSAGSEESLLTCSIDLALVEKTRTWMPSLEHRRPEVYRRDLF